VGPFEISAMGRKRALVDHQVGVGEECGRDGETERSGSLKVEAERDLRRLLDGEVAGMRTFRMRST
jgi:hypothetical protein